MNANETPSAADERFLRYASLTIAWTGKSYQDESASGRFGFSEAEQARFRELYHSDGLPGSARATFLATTVLVMLALLALSIVFFMAPMLERLAPAPAQPGPIVFLLVLACVVFFILGIGLPVAMRAGAWAGDSFGGGKGTPPKPGDGALAAKMRTQRRRLTLIACGVFFPACLVLLLFNGPRDGVVLAAQVAAFAAMAFSLFVIVRARRRY